MLEWKDENGETEMGSSLVDESTQGSSLIINNEHKWADASYFQTMDPTCDEVFSVKDLKSDLYEMKGNHQEFQMNLHESVRGI